MKNKFKKVIASGALVSMLAVSAFSVDNKLLISYTDQHWAQSTVMELIETYKLGNIFTNKDLDSSINIADFQIAVRRVINEEYFGIPESTNREAIVSELVNIWAKETDTDLATVPVFAMIFYSDYEKINPKYNAGIDVAYMKNIAKGRGESIFAPKSNVTYGELGALLEKTKEAIEKEDGIVAGKFETRASIEVKHDQAIFDFELFNHFTKNQNLIFGSGQSYELTIHDEKGKEVYRYSDGKAFTMALVMKSIDPGESLKWQDTWNLKDKEGNLLTKGNYTAKIDVLVIYKEGEVPIPKDQLSKNLEFSI